MEEEKLNKIMRITGELSKDFYKKLYAYMESMIKENRQYSNEILHISSHLASKGLFSNIRSNMIISMNKEKREICLDKNISELKQEILDIINAVENIENSDV